ncbi:Sialic acid-binding Ig-like lectin 14 [Tupaia chinensis]|uniref:Sialic acid-binding Ig-like lectin 14 n=1 Tax=Tupaia chinensis TaxID=246437 RepID=L9JEY8_TUPCH|nr:Sialic acid-binding Ig-like lectin 14 [Tupaia chinensis]
MLALLLLSLLWGGTPAEGTPEDQLQEWLTVQEGLCALVPCSFSYPWTGRGPLYISWFRERDRKLVATDNPARTQKEETQGRFHLLGNFRTKNCSLHISDARMADTGRYFFLVESEMSVQRAYRDKLLNLQVTALTEKPTIHVPESLESGQPTSLRCGLPGSCGGGQRLTFSWEGDALRGLDSGTLRSSMLTLTPTPQDHGTSLTCRVKLEGAEVTTERTVYLNVTYASQSVTTTVFQGSHTESPYRCQCGPEKQEGSWPLILTLIRGTLMGVGFLLTYGLTWIYYTRCGSPQGRTDKPD